MNPDFELMRRRSAAAQSRIFFLLAFLHLLLGQAAAFDCRYFNNYLLKIFFLLKKQVSLVFRRCFVLALKYQVCCNTVNNKGCLYKKKTFKLVLRNASERTTFLSFKFQKI